MLAWILCSSVGSRGGGDIGVCEKEHSSGKQYTLECWLSHHQISGWIAVPAAGLQGTGSQKRMTQTAVRPIPLLTLSLPTLLDSNLPGTSLWTGEFNPFRLRLCLSRTLGTHNVSREMGRTAGTRQMPKRHRSETRPLQDLRNSQTYVYIYIYIYIYVYTYIYTYKHIYIYTHI